MPRQETKVGVSNDGYTQYRNMNWEQSGWWEMKTERLTVANVWHNEGWKSNWGIYILFDGTEYL